MIYRLIKHAEGLLPPGRCIFLVGMKKNDSVHADQRYIDGLVNNNSPVINEIYEKYYERIQRLVVHNNGDAEDARDLFQEVLVVLFHKGHEGFTLTCPFSYFLYIACRSRWINELKKRGRRRVTINDVDGFHNDTSIADEWAQIYTQEKKEQLFYREFQKLGPSCRELLGLSWTQNPGNGKYNSLYEIAELTGRTYGYVRRKISECRSRLMQRIRESCDFKDL